MNLTRRGFLGALCAVALGSKVVARALAHSCHYEMVASEPFTWRCACGAAYVQPPYSIPAFLNEHDGRWRFSKDSCAWTDDEIMLNGWGPTEVHRGPRWRMSKAPRDPAYHARSKKKSIIEALDDAYDKLEFEPPGPGVPLPDFIEFIRSAGPDKFHTSSMALIDDAKMRSDERQEIREREWRSLWSIPDRRKMA